MTRPERPPFDSLGQEATSVLFDRPPGELTGALPSFARDLNIDQIIDAVAPGRDEYDLLPFLTTPLADPEAVAYRHEVFGDLDGTPLFERITLFAQQMRSMRRYLQQADRAPYHHQRQRWHLDAVEIYCDAVATLADDLAVTDLKSRALQGVRDHLRRYVGSPAFDSLRSERDAVAGALDEVTYCVHISGTRVRVSRYEGQADYSAEVVETFAKFKQADVDPKRPKLTADSGMTHVEARILELVAKLHPEPFAALHRFSEDHRDFVDPVTATFDREIQFYVAYLEHIAPLRAAGLCFAYPQVVERATAVRAYETFDLALAAQLIGDQREVVRNDFELHPPERVLVVTGANQGGKTTFARTFGQLAYLGSLGCPVPGTTAALSSFDGIYTHFEQSEDIHTLRGRLKDDLVRMREILELASSRSIIILNEPFESTTWNDATWLGRLLLERITDLDALCVVVTFIDELTEVGSKTVSMVAGVAPEDPTVRTLRVERRPADGLAHAFALAEKHDLTYDRLKGRLAS